MGKALINVDIASLFIQPSEHSELADEVLYGMAVDLLDREGSYFQVMTHYQYEGFVHEKCLINDDEHTTDWLEKDKYTVLSPYLDIKEEASVLAPALISVPRGSIIAIESNFGGVSDGWTKVGLANGTKGYVRNKCIAPESKHFSLQDEQELRNNICSTAKTYLGSQYRWGGKTPLGIDCSGLCSIAYLLNGSTIYRDAHIVKGFDMKQIPLARIKPADLLFYDGHVVMYLGEGLYVHSTSHKDSAGVVLNSLDPDNPLYREDLDESVIRYAGTIFD
ncbi:MAG: C40 family peptidase [Eubacteriaceae bacterium]|nr:C40 family peptidase [Eubacteriaceae bacterium]